MKKIIYCNITPAYVFITVRFRWLYFLEYDVDYFAEKSSLLGTLYSFKRRDYRLAGPSINRLYAAYAAQQELRGEENESSL